MKKAMIAYYSRKGKNYLNGSIVDLPVGNTAVIARKISDLTGASLFEIDTVDPYPEDYDTTTGISLKELKSNFRPAITGSVSDMDSYEIIYLGYPNWWGTMPMAVFTFLESNGLSGKTIVPFCTHEGSGLGKSERDIKLMCPGSRVLPGIAIRGGSVSGAGEQVKNWLSKLELI
jgi:flavodoxin